MNKDKIIKDLKELNDKLKSQYMEEQARNFNLNYINKSLQKEIKEYQDMYFDKAMIITKAIDKLYTWGEVLDPKFQKEMLNILKGDDEDEIQD